MPLLALLDSSARIGMMIRVLAFSAEDDTGTGSLD